MPSSSASASNWDFTPVINLIRSPTYEGGEQSIHKNRLHLHSSPVSQKTAEYDVKNLNNEVPPLKDASRNSPVLGDFGVLWEALGNSNITPPTTPKSKPHIDVHATPLEQLPQPTKPIVILKRPSTKDTGVEKPGTSDQTSKKPIPTLNISLSCHSPPRSAATFTPRILHRHDQQNRPGREPSTSESNTGAESDVCPNVFDRPLLVSSMIPSQIGVAESIPKIAETPPSSFDEPDELFPSTAIQTQPGNGTLRVQPLSYKSATDQRVGVLAKLLKNFPDYADLVTKLGRAVTSKKQDVASRPIHVFVDMSNIMCGFHDAMKISRNIPIKVRIRRLPLSFRNFSLILERGRPAAKRVLVGSDRYAAINDGEQLGYEANILDRVQKVKQRTPRPQKFRRGHPRASSQDGGHSSETNDMADERWVEQGVDEILHLKILESLLDTDQPATIVLATGDAAEAEFSGGFMKMVERALQRGWNVELVSFSQGTSYAYRKKEFRTRWGGQFQMIALDEYLEELLEL